MISLLDRKPPGYSVTLKNPQANGAEPKCIDIEKLQNSFGAFEKSDYFRPCFHDRRGKKQACQLFKNRPALRYEMTLFYKKNVQFVKQVMNLALVRYIWFSQAS